MLGDQHAALVGQTCFRPGQLKNTYGTGCFLVMNTGDKKVLSSHGLLTTLAYRFGDQPAVYALEGSIAITGALVQWVRDNLGMIRTSDEIETLARSVDDNGGVYIVPAFSGLYAPYWKDDARGVIGRPSRATPTRATSPELCSKPLPSRPAKSSKLWKPTPASCLTSSAPMAAWSANNLLMQFQADLLGRKVIRPRHERNNRAWSAAYAAGLACGVYKDTTDLVSNWSIDHTWEPQNLTSKKQNASAFSSNGRKAVTRSFDWVD